MLGWIQLRFVCNFACRRAKLPFRVNCSRWLDHYFSCCNHFSWYQLFLWFARSCWSNISISNNNFTWNITLIRKRKFRFLDIYFFNYSCLGPQTLKSVASICLFISINPNQVSHFIRFSLPHF